MQSRFAANRFTERRVEINNLMVLQDHPLIDYGKYALKCITGADMKKCVYLKSVRDELLMKIEIKEDDDPDDITDIFKIEGNLFDYETPLCKAFNDFNYLLKINMDLFTFDIQGIKTYEEYELNNPVTGDVEKPCLDIDGFCNGGELHGMVWVGSMIYFQDHKCFGNFYELDYNVLVKLQESWWKINANEVAPFTSLENRNYDTSNAGNTHDNQRNEERKDDPTHEPSVCKIRIFEMMKYSFNADEECIAIKESEYRNHSKDNLDAYR
ncbi:hypothetical protein Tco_1384532 [Tanacetum coccineum]